LRSAIALDGQLDPITYRGEPDLVTKLGSAADRCAVSLDHEIALAYASLLGWRLGNDFINKDARGTLGVKRCSQFGGQILGADSDLAPPDFAMQNNLLHSAARYIDRYRKSNSRTTASRRQDCRIDPNELAA
jgi:hypothetical protein